MRITRRGLFATIAAAFVAKPAVEGWSVDLGRATPPYKFHPHTFALVNAPLTRQEITAVSLSILGKNMQILPPFYRDPA